MHLCGYLLQLFFLKVGLRVYFELIVAYSLLFACWWILIVNVAFLHLNVLLLLLCIYEDVSILICHLFLAML